ncbi:TIGR02117 family protein [Nitratidesulfovibrio sp. 1201_IL3209]|uniref:TIGR02117 family protein n=1 Tax=Nitratidesulfovibrio sp. 1201_IL3209 TaxID=3084053 RepID=UPI002FD971FF
MPFTRPSHRRQPSGSPRHPVRRALAWTARGLALLVLGYVLAVAVLGAVPRPTDRLSLPACCLATSAARVVEAERDGPNAPDASDAPDGPDRLGGAGGNAAEDTAQEAPLVTIHVISNGVHADIVLPARVQGEPGLAEALGLDGDTDGAPALSPHAHLAVGWGAREFYLTTPAWDQVRPGVALRALAWAPAALHVDVMPGPPLPDADTRTLHLSRQGYRNLVAFVAASLSRDAAGRPVPIADTQQGNCVGYGAGYGPGSLFFEATGRFSPVRTCNTWAAEALATTGARTPVWTPLPQFVLHHLPPAQ